MANPVTLQQLFDFTKTADVIAAIELIERLDQTYTDLINNARKNNQVITQALSNIRKETNSLTTSLNKLNPTIAEEAKQIAGMNEAVKRSAESSRVLRKQQQGLNDSIKALTKEQIAFNQQAAETQRLQKEEARLIARLTSLESKEAESVARLRLQITERNKQLRVSARESLGLVSIYQRETMQLTALTNRYKEVALSEGLASKEAIRLRNQLVTLRSRIVAVDQSAGNFTRNVGNYASSTARLTNGFRQLASALGFTSLIFAVINAFRSATNTIVEFDSELNNLASISERTREELSDIEDEILEVGRTSVNTAVDVAKTATALVTLGQSEDDILRLLGPVNSLSIALRAPAEEAGELLIQTLNAFGRSSDSAQEFADVIARIRSSTALDFQRIRDALGFVAPTAAALGLSFQRTGALLGVLVDNGIRASRAGRLLSSSFARINKEGISLGDALERIQTSSDRTRTATELFGTESFTLGLILANNTEQVEEYTRQFDNAAGTLDELTNQQLKSLDSQLKILRSTWDDFILSIEQGDGFLAGIGRSVINLSVNVITAFKSIGEFFETSNPFEEGENFAKEFVDTLGEDLIPTVEFYGKRLDTARNRLARFREENVVNGKVTVANASEYRALQDEVLNLEGTLSVLNKEVVNNAIAQNEVNDEVEVFLGLSDAQNNAILRAIRGIQFYGVELGNVRDILNETAREASQLNKAVEEITSNTDDPLFAEFAREDAAAFKEADRAAQDYFDSIEIGEARKQQIISAGFDLGNQIGDVLFSNNRQRSENELAALQQERDRELALAGDNANEKEAIEMRFAASERRIRKQQAQDERNQALFNIGIETAQRLAEIKLAAAAHAAALNPVGAAIALSQIPIAIAVGAAQAGLVLATQLPAFKDGGIVRTDGPIITSEVGHELAVAPDGKMILTGNKGAEIRHDIPKGSQIFTNKETQSILSNFSDTVDNNNVSSANLNRLAENQRSGAMVKGLSTVMQRENDILGQYFQRAMKSMPEIHQFKFSHGEMVRDVAKGVTRYKNVRKKYK